MLSIIINSFNKYLYSAYYVIGTGMSTGNKILCKNSHVMDLIASGGDIKIAEERDRFCEKMQQDS